ncbi:serine/arginine repetitive matrix protein 1-like [Pongo pygmaeus]|uniref:serine/arginine repetitive matrix protein 1-like n=1 Tax=Pongo pygmaeus TaxID=9600 RepID=UPI00300C4FC3
MLRSLHTSAPVKRARNQAKQRLWGRRCEGSKTSSGEASGHPKPHCSPSPAPFSLGADSSEAPPRRGGREGEESREAPPRRRVGKRRPAPRGLPVPRLGPARRRRGASSLTGSGGAALPGRPAQREQQPERPARGRAHGARLDGAAAAAAAAAVRSAQQVTSPSERRKKVMDYISLVSCLYKSIYQQGLVEHLLVGPTVCQVTGGQQPDSNVAALRGTARKDKEEMERQLAGIKTAQNKMTDAGKDMEKRKPLYGVGGNVN